MADEAKDGLKALVTLADGRKAWRDGQGRFRDAASGQFIKVEDGGQNALGREGKRSGQPVGARARAKAHLLQAVRALGLSAESAEDAWGRLVGVQAKIALDEESGARATAAAKLVAQATGLIEEKQNEGEGAALHIEMSEESARALLHLIEEEKSRRESNQE